MHKHHFSTILSLLGALFLLQCGSSSPMLSSRERSQHTSTMDFPEYRLGSGDVIEVKFYKNERFTREQTVRPDGRITLERIGDIRAAGFTPTQLDSAITKAYTSFVIDPEVTVFVKEFSSQKIFVLGEVQEPGIYSLDAEMTYLQALTAAGGPTDMAKLSHVILVRGSETNIKREYFINLRPNTRPYPEAALGYMQPRDIIYVPTTALGSASKIMKQFYATILPPIEVWVRALLWK
ncbi:polysaccharide export protein [candidate division KSB1 bacterium]|nr:polysaccharide export protein [candidate division KSB1 bacterium]